MKVYQGDDPRNLVIRRHARDMEHGFALARALEAALPRGHRIINVRVASAGGASRNRGRKVALTIVVRHVDSRVDPLTLDEVERGLTINPAQLEQGVS